MVFTVDFIVRKLFALFEELHIVLKKLHNTRAELFIVLVLVRVPLEVQSFHHTIPTAPV